MDAFPGYTYFDKTKKVLCVIQVVEDAEGSTTNWHTVMPHSADEVIDINGDNLDDNGADAKEEVRDSFWNRTRATGDST